MLENGNDNMKRKAKMSYAFLALFVVFVGIGYAVLQANLQINGVAKISENRWDIHFENVVVNPDSVSIGTGDSAAVVHVMSRWARQFPLPVRHVLQKR